MPLSKISSGQARSLILLAPSGACLKPFSGPITSSLRLHNQLTGEMQRFRGNVYLDDGAILRSDLRPDGRHVTDLDQDSWHLLTLGSTGAVLGCARFRHYLNPASCDDLGVSNNPLASSQTWGVAFRESVNRELEAARQAGFSYLEIGGWALAPELRGSAEALRSVLAIYALGGLQGGALGIGTATERNSSSMILRKLGGKPLVWDGVDLPGYYDEKYRCGMEILRFDSRYPNPKYATAIQDLRKQIAQVPIICPDPQHGWVKAARNFVPSLAGLMQSPAIAPASA